MATEQKKSVFATLNDININGHTEKLKQGSTELTYLSWAWAWAEVKKLYPDATYTIYKDEQQRPYMEDPDLGLMCYTTVTINGMTHEMWLPVLDGANKAMRRTAYKYPGKKYNPETRQMDAVEKTVEAVTMFDVNKTIMRCLVKNLAMFGLGLYIYAGEDLPESDVIAKEQAAANAVDEAVKEMEAAKDLKEVTAVWGKHKDLQANDKFKQACIKMGQKYQQPQQPQQPQQ